jgi:predicted MFS family arabinose efflux permease
MQLFGVVALPMRAPAAPPANAPIPEVALPTRDRRQWRLGAASGLLVVGQSAMLGFVVLFLHDERGLSAATAAAYLAGLQLLGAGARIVAGRRSDRQDARIPLLRSIALADAALIGATAVLTQAPGALLYPVLVGAGVTAMCWNGLAFTAAAEIAGRRRAGTAMSLQNTIVAVGSTIAPAAFGALVAATSWHVGFGVAALAPLAALAILGPLEADEARRARERKQRLAAAAAA